MKRSTFVCLAVLFACGGPATIPSQPPPDSTPPPSDSPASPPAVAALAPLPADHYFFHELFLDDAAHPVVRVIHPSSRQPPPYATFFRWNGTAWEELPASGLAWPTPVAGRQGQLYAYEKDFTGARFYVWEQHQWRALPPLPGPSSFAVRAATADSATGELVVFHSDGSQIVVRRLAGNAWKQIGPALSVQNRLNPYLQVASIVAERDSVNLAYVDSGVVTASLRREGWSSSPPPGSGFETSPVISLGPAGRLVLSAAEASGGKCHLAISDGTGWRVLPSVADGLQLFYGATIRNDGAPVAFFQRGFPENPQMDLAAATWTDDGGWALSQTMAISTWSASAFFPDGSGFASAVSGGPIRFHSLRPPK